MRVWLISGCSAGFGRALAEAALERGDRVVATARRPETIADLAGERVLLTPLDVTRAEEIEGAVDAAIRRFGRIDVLVNNAGYGLVGAVEELPPDELRELFDTMFLGAVALIRAVLTHMRAQRSGAIVQMSSQGGQFSGPGFGAYCSAKFALEGVSEALAAEVGPLGIRTLIVEPGVFRTEFFGPRLRWAPEIEDYAATVGPVRANMASLDGTQPGDPRKAAAAIIAALEAPDPPLRLALGADAVDNIRAAHERRRADLDAWEDVSRGTALDEGP